MGEREPGTGEVDSRDYVIRSGSDRREEGLCAVSSVRPSDVGASCRRSGARWAGDVGDAAAAAAGTGPRSGDCRGRAER